MGKVDYNLGDTQDYSPVAPDVYRGRIFAVTFGPSKSSGQPMYTVEWHITNGEYAGRKVPRDTISFSPKAASMMDEFLNGIKMERTCGACNASYTKSKQEPKVGAVCPACGARGKAIFEDGEPRGSAFVGKEAMIRTGLRAAQDNPERKFPTVEAYAPTED